MSTSTKKSVRLKPRAYIIIAVVLLAIAAGIGAHVFVKSSFQDRVVIEVGDELPDKSAYLKRDLKKAEIITDKQNYREAKGAGVVVSIAYDDAGGDLIVSYTGDNGANGVCQVSSAKQ